ncbi:MAG: type IV conjugative transfer system protein TraE [Candidatus Thiodiazotropha sp.]
MRRQRYESDKNTALAGETRWRRFAYGLLAANAVLAMTVAGTDTTEKTIVTPPIIERPFWVKGSEVSPEYLEEMARYLSTLVMNATPKSIDANIEIFLRYVAPKSYGDIRSRMTVQADRLKRDDVSTAFYPVGYQTRSKQRQTVVTGDFVTMVGKQRISSVRRSWRYDYSFTGGRLWVSQYMEVDSEDPFEKTVDGTSGPAMGQ